MAKSTLNDSNGLPTGAIFAFANIITRLLEDYKPDKIAVVYDTSAPTFRHEMDASYKANRAEFPEELVTQLPRIKEMVELMGIQQMELSGYEADDIIGTLAKQASNHKQKTFCITSDKDYFQLVDDYVKVLRPSTTPKGTEIQLIDYEQVKEKFGVNPSQVVEVQALIGDSIDNVPGVKGIGEKTAIPLIQEYGNLEGLYENIDKIEKKAVKEKLISGKEDAFHSRELVTMHFSVPIEESHLDCELKKTNFIGLDEFFRNAGFKTLRVKWAEKNSDKIYKIETTDEETTKDIKSEKRDYKLIDTWEKFNLMYDEIASSEILSFDLETSSLDRDTCEIVGIALSNKINTGYYVATTSSKTSYNNLDLFTTNNELEFQALPIIEVLEKLKLILENEKINKIGQNCKFDTYILYRYGVDVNPIEFDSMLASYVLNPDNKHNMDDLSMKWLNYKTIPIKSLIGEKKAGQKSMKDLDPKEISDYACEDADIALKLREILLPELEKTGQIKLAREVEFPTVTVLTKMESNGIAIDTEVLKEISEKISIRSKELTKAIFEEAGQEFNIDSPKQLGGILFDKMGLPVIKQTKTGYSTDVEVLTQLEKDFPIAQHLMEYRTITKLKSTYVDALPKLINPKTGRIHTTYNQTVAATGRLSSTDPNLQNIPIKTKLGKEVRKAFIPGNSNSVILSADYSQIELRIMAHICNDATLTNAFINGHDIHSATAAILYGIDIQKVDSDMRRVAKTVNFGIMYGLGAFGLSQRLSIPRKEAQSIIENYFDKYAGIKKYIDETIHSTEMNGYAETLSGRRRYFSDIKSSNRTLKQQAERAAINLPIQGTASDMIKISMIKIHNELEKRNLKSLMMLQVHDELVFEVPNNELEEVKQIVKSNMENALPLGSVPVVAEYGIGTNWFEAH